ncbi:periplasmic binding protein, partial [Baffinella frigidus]
MVLRKRVLSLLGGATETVCRLGCADLLIGRSHECDWPPSVLSLPAMSASRIDTTGSSLSIDLEVRSFADRKEPVYELLVADVRLLDPDLVIVQDHCRVCAVTPQELEGCGNLNQLVLKPCTLDETMGDVLRIADALGVPERGRELHSLLSAQLAAVRAAVGTVDPAARPRVAVLEWCAPLMGCGYWIPELIELAGGEPVLAGPPGGKTPTFLSVDALLEARPDVVIFALCGFDVSRAARELRAPAATDAVDKLRAAGVALFVMDGNALVNRSGPRLVESAEAIAEAVWPNL